MDGTSNLCHNPVWFANTNIAIKTPFWVTLLDVSFYCVRKDTTGGELRQLDTQELHSCLKPGKYKKFYNKCFTQVFFDFCFLNWEQNFESFDHTSKSAKNETVIIKIIKQNYKLFGISGDYAQSFKEYVFISLLPQHKIYTFLFCIKWLINTRKH